MTQQLDWLILYLIYKKLLPPFFNYLIRLNVLVHVKFNLHAQMGDVK